MIVQVWPESQRNVRLGTPIQYFRTHFCGTSMRTEWEVPELVVSAPKTRPRDFVPWSLAAPAVSDRARFVLEPLVGADAEFLPLAILDGRQFWAVNVTTVVDCVDLSSSKCVYSPEDGRVMNILEYRFRPDRTPPSLVFKVPEPSPVFAQVELARAIRAEGLTGVRFVDPGVNQMSAIMRGGPVDLVPVESGRGVRRRRTRR